jgi:prepilin-type N-terminal cleavage/methylation domain-containing protein/prepilin-type processing-associated H-X9-DG protein
MQLYPFNFRVILALVALLAAIAFLYYQRTDHVPHDRDGRVMARTFWNAVSRKDVSQRPTDIIVYAPHLGIQLVTCVGHPPNRPAAAKYLYVKDVENPGGQTVEARLLAMNIPFRTPWWDTKWMQNGPWVSLGAAGFLLIIPFFTGLYKILVEAKSSAPAPDPVVVPSSPKITAADLEKVSALDAILEGALTRTTTDEPRSTAPTKSPAVPVAPMVLKGGPLEAVERAPEEKKDYRGEFYPVSKPKKVDGFTLVELLVVIGVIGVLISLLLPALSGARKDANQIVCAANLHNLELALRIYEDQNNGYIPASYSYQGQAVNNGVQTYAVQQYTHWSYFLYGNSANPNASVQCPELDQGGLPPTNTTPDNMLPGQIQDVPGVIDDQAPRCAYTLNEALSPRNKFALGFQNAVRVYQLVVASSIPNPAGTILATEWGPDGARMNQQYQQAQGNAVSFNLWSHLPIHGFIGLNGTDDMYTLPPGTGYRRVTAADLDPDPLSITTETTRLDWVGRNHGHANTGYPNQRTSNFLYLDGHVDCKSIYDTLAPFEWGQTFFTLNPNNDLQQ